MKTFPTISQSECEELYVKILRSSNKKWSASKILAETNDYGNASSIAIISIEEQVKALILFLDSKGFEFRKVPEINTFFKNHEFRYVLAYAMFLLNWMSEELKNWINNLNENPEEARTIIEESRKDRNYYLKHKKTSLYKKLIYLKREIVWFSSIEEIRQNGFYSDFKGNFKTPEDITEKEYATLLSKLEKVRKFGDSLIRSMNHEDEKVKKYYQKFVDEAKQKDFYSKVGQWIKASKKVDKKNPFISILNLLS